MKSRMLTLCCSLSLGLLVHGNAMAGTPLKIGLAAEPYPPFSTKNSSGQWSGFEVDVLNQLCREMKTQCQITEVAWDGLIPSLQSKKIDVIFNSMSITPERQKVISFSKPYYYTDSMFVGRKGSKLDPSPAGMRGKTLGVQSSTVNANYAMKRYAQSASIKYYNTQDELNADMAAGRIDAMLLDALAASDFLASKDGSALESKGLATRDPMFGPGVGAGLRKQDTALKQQFDAAIDKLIKSGNYDVIQKKYFKISILPK
ncbi:transporter substrate-binding domain-containing protein [Craterilacuibacter sinensis]|uniref:Transporter substrate-binding domain-containing protein n=1 Tax=Craterilacuibacter sinensis TaxID=2686017 RepID=A0A845BQU6_9NEIS|nr:transporter substrate-binding domain-containing protein [Craterilacuibacter sinensis]MXR37614.1 transporter substrate-binding domain-containing protein [Craterilacuibacter sinensis]